MQPNVIQLSGATPVILRDGDCAPADSLATVLRRWYADRVDRNRCRRARAQARRQMMELPDHLRHDVGLNESLPEGRFVNGGRTFVIDDRPDATLSGWTW